MSNQAIIEFLKSRLDEIYTLQVQAQRDYEDALQAAYDIERGVMTLDQWCAKKGLDNPGNDEFLQILYAPDTAINNRLVDTYTAQISLLSGLITELQQ